MTSSLLGVDAYEASLELGADGVKKSRKLGKIVHLFRYSISIFLSNS